ncbi:unnamed protein product [Caenorhabditis auriculariae]|uniref:Uncharacterized protein n=1 Tax=Caenorhabditis auriculariae TaxID=2777116 RepID=A0A8S1H017_9PELO|nr:unnamed protein product [Caenorhabditis auriculariae]
MAAMRLAWEKETPRSTLEAYEKAARSAADRSDIKSELTSYLASRPASSGNGLIERLRGRWQHLVDAD